MSLTAIVWALTAAGQSVLSLSRPVWAICLYMLTFFMAPHLWWWGDQLPDARYAFWAGNILLGSVLFFSARSSSDVAYRLTSTHRIAIAMLANATFVHFVISSSPDVSEKDFIEFYKFVLLFFLLWRAIQNKADFRQAIVAIALGAAYIGYEITVNERGTFSASRLEGVGAPGADTANGLACLMLTALPLIGSLFIGDSRRDKLVVLAAAPLVLNVVLLCNSRGAFLGLIGAGLMFVFLARGPSRKKAIRVTALASVLLYMLLGDPEILQRFTTTFAGSEERDNSANTRLEFWTAGLLMLQDYPFGDGGGAFKYVHGDTYLPQAGSDQTSRSLHNGYLTEATDWGVQGLVLKLLFIGTALLAAHRTSTRCRLAGRTEDALVGVSVIVATTAFLICCVFGSYLGNEWGYWVIALLVRYSQLYAVAEEPAGGRAAALERGPLLHPAVSGA